MTTVLLEIVTPDKLFFNQQIQALTVPGYEGELGILPGHAPMVARLKPGSIRITGSDGNVTTLRCNGGMLEVFPQRITLITSSIT